MVAWTLALAAATPACKSGETPSSPAKAAPTSDAQLKAPGTRRARPLVAVTGRVVHDGNGVGGATMLLSENSLDGGAFGRPGKSNLPLVATTDKAGVWRLGAVPTGTYHVTAAGAEVVGIRSNHRLARRVPARTRGW